MSCNSLTQTKMVAIEILQLLPFETGVTRVLFRVRTIETRSNERNNSNNGKRPYRFKTMFT